MSALGHNEQAMATGQFYDAVDKRQRQVPHVNPSVDLRNSVTIVQNINAVAVLYSPNCSLRIPGATSWQKDREIRFDIGLRIYPIPPISLVVIDSRYGDWHFAEFALDGDFRNEMKIELPRRHYLYR